MTASRMTLLALLWVSTSTLLFNFLSGCGESPPAGPPIASAPPPPSVPPSYLQDPVDVLRVIDGDTIEIYADVSYGFGSVKAYFTTEDVEETDE